MNPDEKIYAEWDCPQAVAVHAYAADQEDELNLVPGDLINILRKMPDGNRFKKTNFQTFFRLVLWGKEQRL